MISMRRISLGGGFRYLMDSVAVGDGTAEHPESLAAYYAASGTPPGCSLAPGSPAWPAGAAWRKDRSSPRSICSTCSVCAVTRSPVNQSDAART